MPDWAIQIVALVVTGFVTGGGVYAAIRADLARIAEKAEQAVKSSDRAHDRIDSIFQPGRA